MRDQRVLAESQFKNKSWSNPFIYGSRKKNWEKILDEVINYFSELPVISFNGQRYDINVIRAPLIRYLSQNDTILFAIKRNNAMKCIKTKHLKFLDITNFVAPGFSYSAFIKAYDCQMEKAVFHPIVHFSPLCQQNISSEEYMSCCQVWKDEGMKTLRDYLIYYNNLCILY